MIVGGTLRLEILDPQGRRVQTLANHFFPAKVSFGKFTTRSGETAPHRSLSAGGGEEVYKGGVVILVDETLQPISLRMYNQAVTEVEYTVRVEESTRQGATSSPFHDRISALVDPASEPWKSFSATVAEAVAIHARVLKTKINL